MVAKVAGGGRRPGAQLYRRCLPLPEGAGGTAGFPRGDSVTGPRPGLPRRCLLAGSQHSLAAPLRSPPAASGVAGDCKMADGRDDAADQLKQWKIHRGSQVPASTAREPRAESPAGFRGWGAPSPGTAAEGEAPWARPGLAPAVWSGARGRQARGWRLPAGPADRDGGHGGWRLPAGPADKGGSPCWARLAPGRAGLRCARPR